MSQQFLKTGVETDVEFCPLAAVTSTNRNFIRVLGLEFGPKKHFHARAAAERVFAVYISAHICGRAAAEAIVNHGSVSVQALYLGFHRILACETYCKMFFLVFSETPR